ncbi:unnamed protein product [Polarella glacialis]|uniref:RanBP2-type domain-containing protein n=2 Tax=Polarella glacialis TaxID=89957 RepID=A0A813FWP7_POLGL|nr:unnamed protein product [Polarella glacialis]
MAAPAKVKLSKAVAARVRELNESGSLQGDLRLGAVAKPLSELSEEVALEVLEGLLESAAGIADPTTFVAEAARAFKAQEQEQEEEWPEEAEAEAEAGAEGWGEAEEWAPGPVTGHDDGDFEAEFSGPAPKLPAEVKAAVSKLNSGGALVEQLDIDRVQRALAHLSEKVALATLKDLEENCDTIDKPNAWVFSTVRRTLTAGRKDVDMTKLIKRVRWINNNVSLAFPLHIGNVLDILHPIDPDDAMEILKYLVEKCAEIESPQSWLRRAAARSVERKQKGKGKGKGKEKGKDGKGKDMGKGKFEAKGQDSFAKGKGKFEETGKGAPKGKGKGTKGKAQTKPLTASEKKVLRALNVINEGLTEQISYEQVKPSLDLVDEQQQLAFLEMLQEKANEITKPIAWLASACRKHAQKFDAEFQDPRKRKKEGAEWSADAEGDEGAKKFKKQEWKDGDWECSSCGAHQFASRTECRSCSAPKPEGDAQGGADAEVKEEDEDAEEAEEVDVKAELDDDEAMWPAEGEETAEAEAEAEAEAGDESFPWPEEEEA